MTRAQSLSFSGPSAPRVPLISFHTIHFLSPTQRMLYIHHCRPSMGRMLNLCLIPKENFRTFKTMNKSNFSFYTLSHQYCILMMIHIKLIKLKYIFNTETALQNASVINVLIYVTNHSSRRKLVGGAFSWLPSNTRKGNAQDKLLEDLKQ